ncbi:uncharacterized protein LOC105801194 [Gossypium raimondii]|uniref:uncharacterized protein LOC105801194 n=1 Tax=Gossypium raimondii TaxID=29730 RepID=UPI00063ABE1B|nr:uncharacterized protein LOC105801194 [Gossypium raimondii]
MKSGACCRCGSFNHYLRDCLEKSEKEKAQTTRPINIIARGRPPHNPGNVSGSRGVTKDFTMRSKARAPAKAYAIHAREDASAPDVIINTFSLYNTDVTALIDPGSTHSYVCTNLVSSKNLPVEVLNPLGQYDLVDKVCKNCHLMTRGYSFSVDLMLLSFDEFNVILGMNWLTLHDAVVNCRRKLIILKGQNGEKLCIESDSLSGLPIVISAMSAQKYRNCLDYNTTSISIAPYI